MSDDNPAILCSIDYSLYSSQVIDWAAGLASVSRSELVVFHALGSPRERLAPPSPRQDAAACRKSALEKMETLLKGKDVPWRPWIEAGDAVSGVSRAADETGARLVVAASHGLSGIRRMVLGSVVERMAREVHHPMLILRARDPLKHESFFPKTGGNDSGCIAAACDLPPGRMPVAAIALDLAEKLGLRLVLVHAVGSPVQLREGADSQSYAGCQEKLLESLKEKLLLQVRDSGHCTVPCEAMVLTGDPAEEISGAGRRCGAMIMVVGVKHRSRFGKWITGSTTEALIREGSCHVLTVPEMPDQKGLW